MVTVPMERVRERKKPDRLQMSSQEKRKVQGKARRKPKTRMAEGESMAVLCWGVWCMLHQLIIGRIIQRRSSRKKRRRLTEENINVLHDWLCFLYWTHILSDSPLLEGSIIYNWLLGIILCIIFIFFKPKMSSAKLSSNK